MLHCTHCSTLRVVHEQECATLHTLNMAQYNAWHTGERGEQEAEAEAKGSHAAQSRQATLHTLNMAQHIACCVGERGEQEAEAEAKGSYAAKSRQAGHRLPSAT